MVLVALVYLLHKYMWMVKWSTLQMLSLVTLCNPLTLSPLHKLSPSARLVLAASLFSACLLVAPPPCSPPSHTLGPSVLLLKQKAPCQCEEEGDNCEPIGEGDYDEVLWNGLCELLSTLAKTMAHYFEPVFKKLFPPLLAYTASSHPGGDRYVVVQQGAVCETPICSAWSVIPLHHLLLV